MFRVHRRTKHNASAARTHIKTAGDFSSVRRQSSRRVYEIATVRDEPFYFYGESTTARAVRTGIQRTELVCAPRRARVSVSICENRCTDIMPCVPAGLRIDLPCSSIDSCAPRHVQPGTLSYFRFASRFTGRFSDRVPTIAHTV